MGIEPHNQITRELIEAIADQTYGGFLPRSTGFEDCCDLDGTHAHMFLQGLGFTMWGHKDIGRNGVAFTADGIILSTNGHVSRDWARADKLRAANL